MKVLVISIIFLLPYWLGCWCQDAPGGSGNPSTAIHKDSSIIKGWAGNCKVERGYIKISDTTLIYEGHNKASHGEPENAIGKADGKVVSLGDSGMATIILDNPLVDGNGADFAVFENGLQSPGTPVQYFLELAFVEVSSNGEHFIRFPAISNTPVTKQVGTFDQLEPANIHNLAGKYPKNYGTPFDLHELKDSAGIDIHAITAIRIIDVVGSIYPAHATHDAQGNIVNDPWPTPFHTGGFDLDGVGFIHLKKSTSLLPGKALNEPGLKVFPNPANGGDRVNIAMESQVDLSSEITLVIRDSRGRIMYQKKEEYNKLLSFVVPEFNPGLYFIELKMPEGSSVKKLLISE
jgi:hypothetical protein